MVLLQRRQTISSMLVAMNVREARESDGERTWQSRHQERKEIPETVAAQKTG
jgi:hypothetical protein